MSPWRTLGLDRTEDVGAIRRAYAKRLKAIDVDADPASFIALRQALEEAMAYASVPQHQPAEEDEAWPEFPGSPENSLSGEVPLAASDIETAQPEEDSKRFLDLEALLQPGDEEAPFPDEAKLFEALQAILCHPQMANVDHTASVEAWLAELLYYSIPRSDAAIPLVVDHFGWEERAGAWDQPLLIEELVRRRLALKLLDRVADPKHELHKAWLDLTSDRDRIGLRSIAHGNKVASLLETIRSRCPDAEGALNSYRVALWDERLGRSIKDRLGNAMLVFIGLLVLARVIAVMNGPDTSAYNPSQPVLRTYTEPAVDLEPLLREATGRELGVSALKSANPALYEELAARWEEARKTNDQSTGLDVDLRSIIQARMREALRGGSEKLQADYLSRSLERMAWLRDQGVEDCAETERVETRTFPEPLQRRRWQVLAHALQEVRPKHPPPELAPGAETKFRIPGSIFEAAARSAGLDKSDFREALNGRGNPAQRCAAQMGLIKAAIAARGPDGRELIRAMSAVF